MTNIYNFARTLFVFITCFISVNLNAQNLGFEDPTVVSPPTNYTAVTGNWRNSNIPDSVRTGAQSMTVNNQVTTGTTIGTTNPFVTTASAGNFLITMAWAKANTTNGVLYLGYRSGTTNTLNPSATAAGQPVNMNTSSWTRIVSVSAATVAAGTYGASMRAFVSAASPLTHIYIDDVIMYASTSSTPDLSAPNPASGGLVAGNNISWSNGTDNGSPASGVEGVIILKANGSGLSAPTLNDQAMYSTVNGAAGTSSFVQGGNTWTVVANIAGSGTTSFTDPSGGGGLTYAIYMRDAAYNYSAGHVAFSGPCTDPATAGTATSAPVSPVCSGQSTFLNVVGGTGGIGQTYQWQSSTTLNGTYTNLSGVLSSSSYNITPTADRYYRCQIICSGGTPVYTDTLFLAIDPPTAPTSQPDSLTLTPLATSIVGTFTNAPVPSTGYLVVRTATNVAPTPVNGTVYTVGSSGIGQVESVGTSLSFTSTGLTPLTTYYYWIYSFKNNSCTSGPQYQSVSPLSGNTTTTAPLTYTWVATADSANWTTAASWSPARTTPDATDILQFTNGGSSIALAVPTQTVGRITVANNTAITLRAATATTLTIAADGTAAHELTIANGSTLTNHSLAAIFTIAFTTGSTSSVAGVLEMNNNVVANKLNFTNGIMTIESNGKLAAGGTVSTTAWTGASATTLIVNGTYEHKYTTTTGTIPAAAWNTGSTALISGFTTNTSLPAGMAQTYSNFTWNCASQTGNLSLAGTVPTAVNGTFTMTSTGTGQLRLGSTSSYNTTFNNFSQTGGSLDPNTTTGAPTLNITGTFNQTGGTFLAAGTGATTLNFNGTSGAQSVNFNNAAPAGPLVYRISNASGINLTGSGTLTTNFTLNSGGGIRVTTLASTPVTTTLNFVYNTTGTTLTYDAPGNITATTKEFPSSSSPANLTINMGAGNAVTIPFNRSLAPAGANGVLTMTSGDLNLTSNTLTLGTSASFPGTLTYTAGGIRLTTGAFTRWFGTTGLPNAAGTTGVGVFPISNGLDNRNVSLYGTAQFTGGGTISISHNGTGGLTSITPVLDGAYSIDTRTNASWSLTTGNGLALAGSTMGIRVTGGGLITSTIPANLRVMQAAAVVGAHIAGNFSAGNYRAVRENLSLANLAGPHHIGAAAADIQIIYTAINTGDWSNGATWEGGVAPGINDIAKINPGVTVTVDASNACKALTNNGILLANGNSLTIDTAMVNNGTVTIGGGSVILNGGNINVANGWVNNGGSTFTLSSGSLTIGPNGGGNKALNAAGGTSTISGGTLTLNGALTISAGSFSQTNGSIVIDGNDGVAATSSATTVLFNVSAVAATISFTGGSVTIVDPPFGTAKTINIVQSALASNHTAFSGTHSWLIGDGVSTTAGGADGFVLDGYASGGRTPFNNVTINGGSGTNRFARNTTSTANGTVFKGTFTINSGSEFRWITDATGDNGIMGNVVNNGTLTSTVTVHYGIPSDMVSSGFFSLAGAQTISGSGVFRNTTAGPTAEHAGMTINNPAGLSIAALSGTFRYSGALTFTSGLLTTGNVIFAQISGATLTGAGQTTGWINGNFQKNHAAGSFNSVHNIGDATNYTPVTISGGTGSVLTGGDIIARTDAGDHANIGSANLASGRSVNRTYTITAVPGITFAANSITVNLNWVAADVDTLSNTNNFYMGKYDAPNWSYPTVGTRTATSITASNISSFSSFAVAEGCPNAGFSYAASPYCGNPGTASITLDSAAAAGNFTASPGISLNSSTGAVDLGASTPGTYTVYNTIAAVNGCAGALDSATITIDAPVSPAVSIAASETTICAGNAVTFVATPVNGGVTPSYQWQVNGANTGTNNDTLVTSTLADQDVVTVIMTSSLTCVTAGADTSNGITITVNPNLPVSVTIEASPNDSVCAGASVTFTATPVNGGSTPAYQWQVNGSNVGTDQDTYTSSSLANGDVVTVILNSNITPCATGNPDTSNAITMTVEPVGVASVTIGASPSTNICLGTMVTFTATPVDGGTTPSYQWQVNGINAGTNSDTYASNSLADQDQVTVIMTSSNICVTGSPDTSNVLTITVTGAIAASVSLSTAATTICDGTAATFTAAPTGGGSTPTYEFFVNNVSVQNGTSDNYNYIPVNNDSVYVIMTSSFACATGSPATSSAVYMTVNSTPAAPTITAHGPTTFCEGGSVLLTSSYTGGGNLWTPGGTTTDSVYVTAAGSYTVMYSPGGCTSPASAPVVITVNANPTVNITGNSTVCANDSILLTANATAGSGTIATYQWVRSTIFDTTLLGTNATQYVTSGGDYTVVVTNSNGCSTTSAIHNVNSVINPTVSISGGNTLCAGTSVLLTANANPAPGTVTNYQWVLNGTTNVGTNSSTFNAIATGSYTVTIITSVGCSATSAAHVISPPGPLSGTYTIGAGAPSCTNYASFATAVADVNTLGVAGNVIFNIAGGYTETVPAGGLILKQCALSSGLKSGPTQTVTFQKSGAGVNPLLRAFTPGTSTTLDGVVKVVGMDNVTFDGIDVAENAANTTATTQMEMAFGIYKCDGNDAAVGVSINNGTISLNKANTGAIAVRVANTTETGAAVTFTGTINDGAVAAAARNRVSVVNNSISNVYTAVLFNASTGSAGTLSLNDSANVVSGNNITNFGGAATAPTVVSLTDNRYFSIANNTINGGASTAAALTGINGGSGPFGAITGNTVTLTSTAITTQAVIGITYGASGTNNNGSITGNTVQNCSFTGGTTGTFTGITSALTGTTSTITVSNNIVQNNGMTGSGTFTGVANTSSPTTLIMENNTVNGNTKTTNSTTAATMSCISVGTPANSTVNNNTVTNNTIIGQGATATLNCVIASTSIYTFNGNTISNNGVTSISGTSIATVSGYTNAGSPTGETLTNNTIRKLYVTGTSTGLQVIRGFNHNTVATSTRNLSSNVIDSLYSNAGTSAVITGIISTAGGTVGIYKNKIFNLLPGQNGTSASVAKGISNTSGTNVSMYNNLINLDIGSSPLVGNSSVIGVEVTAGTNVNIYFNTIRLAGNGSTSTFGSSGISLTSTTPVVDIRNNIVMNLTNAGGGTAAASAIGLRRTSTAITGYASTSNNNLWYSGTPSASHLLYFDGTNSDQTIAAFQSHVAGRESASNVENVSFQSTVPTNANFLKVNTGTATLVESGAQPISTPSITDDYFGTLRNATTPDIGAHEDNFASSALTIVSAIADPNTGQCVAQAHDVTAVVTPGLSAISYVRLFWQYNGGALDSVTMVNTSGNSWEGTIPAATPVNALVTWYVKAADATYTKLQNGTSYKDAYLLNASTVAAASPSAPVCPGQTVSLNVTSIEGAAGFATVGSNTTTVSTTGNPYRAGFGAGSQVRTQMLVLASELLASNLSSGNFTNIAFTATGAGGVMSNLSIKIGHTSVSTLTATYETTPMTLVFDTSTYTPAVGLIAHNLETPFAWNGTSNIIIDVCQTNQTTGTTTLQATSPGFNATNHIGATTACSNTAGATFTTRPVIRFGGIVGVNYTPTLTWVWTPGPLSGSTVNAAPASTTIYTATGTDANGCSVSDTITVTVNPPASAPFNAVNSTQCGIGVPSASVTSNGGTVRWYLTSTGGSPVFSGDTTLTGSGYSISDTTIFYVGEYNGLCESTRIPVTAYVTFPDEITASSSADSICPYVNINLSSTQGTTNTYTFVWTANPATGSGIPTSMAGQNIIIQATAGGTYNYIVTGTDTASDCVVSDTIAVFISDPPTTPVPTATPDSICPGDSVELSANAYTSGNGLVTTLINNNNGSSATGFDITNTSAVPITIHYISFISSAAAGTIATESVYVKPGGFNCVNPTNVSTDPTWTLHGTVSTTSAGTTPTLTTIPLDINITIQPGLKYGFCIGGLALRYTDGTSGCPVMASDSYMNIHEGFGGTLTSAIAARRFNGSVAYSYLLGDSTWQYSWTPVSGLSDPNSQFTLAAPTATTTYTVQVTDTATGCSNYGTVAVTVNPVPTVPVAHDSSQCGTSVPTAYVTGSGGTFRWYLVSSGGNPIAGENGSSLVSYSIASTTTFYVSEFNGFCEGPRVAVTQTVTGADAISITASDTSLCSSETVLLNASSSNPNYTYTWTSTNGGNLLTTSGSSVSAAPSTIGSFTYTVTGTDNTVNPPCLNVSTVIVTVNLAPSVAATPANDTICPNVPLQLNAAGNIAGNAMSFNSGFSNYIAVAPSVSLDLYSAAGNSLTLEALVRPGSFSTNAGIISHYQTSGGGASYFLREGATSPFTSLSSGGVTAVPTSPTTGLLTANNWYHVAAVYKYNSSTTNDSVFIYINGSLKGSGVSVVNHSTDSLRIGSDFSARYFNGTMDEVRIWNVALDSTILQSWDSRKLDTSHPSYSNLVLYYDFDETNFSTVTDRSGNGNTGYIRNGATPTASTAPLSEFTYSWSPSTGLSSSSIANPTYTSGTPGTTIFTVTATAPNGCTAIANDTITVRTEPATPIATDSTQCGAGVPYAFVTGVGSTFNWYLLPTGGTALVGENGNSLTGYSINSTTTFYVTEYDGICEGPRAALTETVTPSDSVGISATPSPVCQSDTLTLSAVQVGSNNNYTYSWSATPSAGSGISGIVTGQTIVIVPTVSGNYTYTITAMDSILGCNYQNSSLVTVTALPLIAVSTASQTNVCAGTSVTLTGSTNSVGTADVNIGTGITTTTSNTLAPYAVFWETARNQYLIRASELVAAGLSAGNMTSIKFYVSATTASAFNWSGYTIKLGATSDTALSAAFISTGLSTVYGPLTLPAPRTVGANEHIFNTPFNWDGTSNIVVDICFSNDPTNTCTSCYNASGSMTTTYTATGFSNSAHEFHTDGTDYCGIASGTSTLNSNRPNMTFSGQTGVLSGGNYIWQWNPGGLNGNIVNVNPTITTIYTVNATDTVTGCTNSDTAVVQVITGSINPAITTSNDSLCGSGVTTLSWTNPVTTATIQWQETTDTTGTWNNVPSANGNTYISPTLTANHFYRAITSCSQSDTSNIIQIWVINPSITGTTGDERCGAGQVTLSVTGTGTFVWYTNSTGGVPLDTGSTFITNVASSTTFFVEASIGNCLYTGGRQPATAVVTVAPSIFVAVTPSNTVCAGSSVTFTASSGNDPNYTYYWTLDLVNPLFTGNPYTFTADSSRTYYAYAVDSSGGSNDGCAFLIPVNLTVNQLPVISSVTSTPSLICGSGTSQINVIDNSPGATNYYIAPIAHSPVPTPGSGVTVLKSPTVSVPLTLGDYDDGYWSNIAIPFTFNFFGTGYTNIAINTNGYLNMGSLSVAQFGHGLTLPGTATPNNTVCGMQADIDPRWMGKLEYFTIGTTPNRRFIINYDTIPFFDGANTVSTPVNDGTTSFQIHLLENNTIEVHTTFIDNNITTPDPKTQGIENSTGTIAYTVTGRNNQANWNLTAPDAYRIANTVYTYAWTPATGLSDSTIKNPVATLSTTTTYNLIVTNVGTGCLQDDSSATITVTSIPAPKVYPGDTVICSGQSLYQHVIDTGAYSGGYPAGTTVDWVGIATGLSPDDSVNTSGITDFQVVVHLPSSLGGCSASSDTSFVNVHQLDVTPEITSATCGSTDGKIIVNVVGTAPYHFTWTDGVNTIRDIQTSNTSDSITGLAGGFYYLTVIDNEGNVNPGLSCNTGQLAYFVPSDNGPEASIGSYTNVTCNGSADGTATVIQTGGVGTITYSWSPSGGSDATADSLSAGTYTVLVTDGNGCIDTAEVTITEPDVLIIEGSSVNAGCGMNDGIGIGTVTGGTAPYSYQWFDEFFTDLMVDNDSLTGLVAGTYYVAVFDVNGCNNFDTVVVSENCAAAFNLKVYVEGYYLGSGAMQPVFWNIDNGYPNLTDCDTVKVILYEEFSLSATDSAVAILQTDGTAAFILPSTVIGGSYYIGVLMRHTVEISSKLPVTFSGSTSYDYTTSSLQAYDDGVNFPMKEVEAGVWGVYSGDVNQDGTVDATDMIEEENAANAFLFGYDLTDVNGDGASDASDMIIIENNSSLFLFEAHPYP